VFQGQAEAFKKVCRGETDISNASRPISKKKSTLAKKQVSTLLKYPLLTMGLAVVISPANDFVDYLTVAD
jgi:phosphate transport system substrate-binding protein